MRRGGLAWLAVVTCAGYAAACFDFGSLSSSADAGDDASPACGPSQKSCSGACVSERDPSVGCAGACAPCSAPPNAQTVCVLSNAEYVCGLSRCNLEYADCDNDLSNGCETQTTTHANCGACGHDCAELPFCVESSSGYVCSATCDTPNMICPAPGSDAGNCVDPATDNANCGKCANSCAVSNGMGFCDAGNCELTCATNYFACGGQCVLPSKTQCGASCAECPLLATCDTTVGTLDYGKCVSCGSNCMGEAGIPEGGPPDGG